MIRKELGKIVTDLKENDPIIIQRKNFILQSGAGRSCPSNYGVVKAVFLRANYFRDKLDGVYVDHEDQPGHPIYYYYSKIGRLEKRS